MDRNAVPQIDFEAWADLARRDPAAFERLRTELIEDFLQQVPRERQERLRRLQWRIDRTRERASNPLSACIQISRMMWDSVLGDGGLLDALERLRRPCRPPPPIRQARILPFRSSVRH